MSLTNELLPYIIQGQVRKFLLRWWNHAAEGL